MIALLILCIVLTGAMCALAYSLAIYALPLLIAVETARLAHATGAGWIGAGFAGAFAGLTLFGAMACLFATLRSPILRLAIAMVFALPAALAGYALVHGVAREAVPAEFWRQLFSIIGGMYTGFSALARLAAPFAEGRE